MASTRSPTSLTSSFSTPATYWVSTLRHVTSQNDDVITLWAACQTYVIARCPYRMLTSLVLECSRSTPWLHRTITSPLYELYVSRRNRRVVRTSNDDVINYVDDVTGDVLWIPPAIYKSSCTMDVEFFPFDEQYRWSSLRHRSLSFHNMVTSAP